MERSPNAYEPCEIHFLRASYFSDKIEARDDACKNNPNNTTIRIVIKIVAASATFWWLVSGFPSGVGRGGAYVGGTAATSTSTCILLSVFVGQPYDPFCLHQILRVLNLEADPSSLAVH